jgi:RNA polymerase sigma-70 factor (ECF subfamily)
MEPADTDLIARAQTGDDAALDALISQIRPYVSRQLLRYPVSEEDRSDLLQTALLQVVRRIQQFRGDSSFATWLFRVTANEALMLMRRQRRLRARLVLGLDLEDLGSLGAARQPDELPTDEGRHAESASQLRSALAALPEDDRRIVVAHYHEDRGLQEIAAHLSVTESAVRSRLHRARSRLRAILAHVPERALLNAPRGEAA